MPYSLIRLQELNAESPPTECVGYAHGDHKCTHPISKSNRDYAKKLIQDLPDSQNISVGKQLLIKLAALCLCQNRHQAQASHIAAQWYTHLGFKPLNEWIVDSGAEMHVTGEYNFVEYTAFSEPMSMMGVGKNLVIRGKGTVHLLCNQSGNPVTIVVQDVYYTPGMEGSILSVSELMRQGVQVTLTPDSFFMRFPSMQTLEAPRVGGLFYLQTW